MNGTRARTFWASKSLNTLFLSVLAIAVSFASLPGDAVAQGAALVTTAGRAANATRGANALSAAVKGISGAEKLQGAQLLAAIRGRVDWTDPAIADLITEARSGNVIDATLSAQYPELVPLINHLAAMPKTQVPSYFYAGSQAENAASRLCADGSPLGNLTGTLTDAVSLGRFSPTVSNHVASHLGRDVAGLQQLGWIVPTQATLAAGGGKLAAALGDAKGSPAELYKSLNGSSVWDDPEVVTLATAALQLEFHPAALAHIDARLPALIQYIQAQTNATNLPFARASNPTTPMRESQSSMPFGAASPHIQGEVSEITMGDQAGQALQLFHRGFDLGTGVNGATISGSWVASQSYWKPAEITMPWFIDSADRLKLLRNGPIRFPEAAGVEPGSMTPDEFFAMVENNTDPDIVANLRWQAQANWDNAPERLRRVLPESYTVEDTYRQYLIAWHHSIDVRQALVGMGYPQGIHSAHDVWEPELQSRVRAGGTVETNRELSDSVVELAATDVVNVGVMSPRFGAQMGLWSIMTGQRSAHGHMPDELGMMLHRGSAHHVGNPDSPAEMADRWINQMMHHMVGVQGPWGVRGEGINLTWDKWDDALETAFRDDPAYKSTLIQAANRELLPYYQDGLTAGYFTPVHLVNWGPAPWTGEIVEPKYTKREPRTWATGIQRELLGEVKGTMWDIPDAAVRKPVVYLAQAELPRVANYGIGQPTVMWTYADDPVATLEEAAVASQAVGSGWDEVNTVGRAVFYQLADLAITDTANASKYIDGMARVARALNKAPAEMAAAELRVSEAANRPELVEFLSELKF